MGGQFDWLNYDKPRPCPYCGYPCHADFVDVEVGMMQCGPYHCESCGATQIGPHDEGRVLSEIEKSKGWYAPDSEPGSSANVVNGKVVTHQVALAVYRDFYPFSATDFGKKWLREHDPYKEPLPVDANS